MSTVRLGAAALFLAFALTAQASINTCRFNFGVDWEFSRSEDRLAADYITRWIGYGYVQDHRDDGNEVATWARNNSKPLVVYAYIIAFMARRDLGLRDCDVGSPNLCQDGANYIRQNRARILQVYGEYSQRLAHNYSTSPGIIWLIEPDFHQYTANTQRGGGLSANEMADLYEDLTNAIRAHQPNAIFSVDISPWVDQNTWLQPFMGMFSFTHVAGGRTDGNNALIRVENNTTWASIFSLTSRGMIADDGYGVGGTCQNNSEEWMDVNNIRARINDGVVAMTQRCSENVPNWASRKATLATQLAANQLRICGAGGIVTPEPVTVTRTMHPAAAGRAITITPAKDTYYTGDSVTVLALSNSGFRFSHWSGSLSGTNATTTLRITGDVQLIANFVSEATTTPSTFPLTVNVTGPGTVTRSPNATQYDSGTVVQLTANPSTGATFTGWSGGGVSGTARTVSVTMSQARTITATFTGGAAVRQFTLTISGTSASTGTVAATPSGTTFDSGTVVSLRATPAAGREFAGWTGAVTGTANPVSVTMSANRTVTATWREVQTTNGNVISNGDFASQTTGWTALGTGNSNGVEISNDAGTGRIAMGWGGDADTMAVLSQTVSLVGGASYALSFRARGEDSRPLRVALRPAAGGAITGTALSFDLTGSFQTFTGVLTVPTTGSWQLVFLAGGQYWQDVWVDDVQLIGPRTSITGRASRQGPWMRARIVGRELSLLTREPDGAARVWITDLRGRQAAVLAEELTTGGSHLFVLPPGLDAGAWMVVMEDRSGMSSQPFTLFH